MHKGTKRDETRRIRWAADRIAGTTVLVQVDYDEKTGAVIELGDGLVRIRLGDVLPGGRFLPRVDTTVDTICTVEPAEPLPLFEEEPAAQPAMPVLARAGSAPRSHGALSVVSDDDEREAA